MNPESHEWCIAYFLKHPTGSPVRFVLGEPCPCSSLMLATFFPDLETARSACEAHCRQGTKVMMCAMKAQKVKGQKEA